MFTLINLILENPRTVFSSIIIIQLAFLILKLFHMWDISWIVTFSPIVVSSIVLALLFTLFIIMMKGARF